MTLLIILISYEEAKKKMKKREENLKNERKKINSMPLPYLTAAPKQIRECLKKLLTLFPDKNHKLKNRPLLFLRTIIPS